MTVTREELEQFKESLREHAKVKNLEIVLERLKMFYEKFKHIVTEEDANDIKKIVEGMKVMKNESSSPTPYEYLLFLFVLVFVIGVFAFFGFKLYKSLTDRQRKREEKMRAKNSRKKK